MFYLSKNSLNDSKDTSLNNPSPTQNKQSFKKHILETKNQDNGPKSRESSPNVFRKTFLGNRQNSLSPTTKAKLDTGNFSETLFYSNLFNPPEITQ